jgi:thiol-disulfide isomerase/thioredoxin
MPRDRSVLGSLLVPLVVGLAACDAPGASSGAPSAVAAKATASATATPPRGHVEIVEAPPSEPVDALVRSSLSAAQTTQRTLVVYVGATWCEPCQRFHHAAERGELDAVFPTVTLLSFDLDRDGERLAAAGYVSKYIPLFALPGPDGSASGKQIEGGIKGDGAVGNLVPRLQTLLSE